MIFLPWQWRFAVAAGAGIGLALGILGEVAGIAHCQILITTVVSLKISGMPSVGSIAVRPEPFRIFVVFPNFNSKSAMHS
jgi:Pyruvate/2-oxoacid:ferredoxin oxidoreductase gamma subunit